MELNWSNVGQIIAIVTFSAGIVKMVAINPLQVSINSLGRSITEMKDAINHLNIDLKNIDKRLAVVESSTKSAHKRITEVNGH